MATRPNTPNNAGPLRSKTPDPQGMSKDDWQKMIENSRLGRVLAPLVKAIGKLSAGQKPDTDDLELKTLAQRLQQEINPAAIRDERLGQELDRLQTARDDQLRQLQ